MKKYIITIALSLTLVFTVSTNVSAETTAAAKDCKSSWSCFTKAAKSCKPANVQKKTVSKIFGLTINSIDNLSIVGLQNNNCAFTRQNLSNKITNTPEEFLNITDKVAKQLEKEFSGTSVTYTPPPAKTIDEAKGEMIKFESLINDPAGLLMYNCLGTTKNVNTFFKKYAKEKQNVNIKTNMSIDENGSSVSSTATYMKGAIKCSEAK